MTRYDKYEKRIGVKRKKIMKITPEQKEQPKPIEEDLHNENGQIVVSS